ncbi:PAS domain S-box protein [Paenibacillus protaetiae]|uniref:PAS domain S-box protein n=1 Tax=Paenibacillus protaetiae TaxID=2509456 RepID=UPI0013EC3293|nr:PAS domain S-box protein [Paenibacillus protaetiae]
MNKRIDVQHTQLVVSRLRESEERYRCLVEQLPDALLVFADYEIVYVNSSAVQLLGASTSEELIGKPVVQFMLPENIQTLTAEIEAILKIAPSKPELMKQTLIRLDHQPIDVEVKAIPVKFAGRHAVQLIIRDVSERKKMEETLVETGNLYRSLLENTVAGVILAHEHQTVYANPYLVNTLGYSLKQFLELRPLEFLIEEERLSLQEKLLSSRENLRLGFSGRGMTRDGQIVYLEGSFTRVQYAGKPAILGTLHDVTFKKEREDELRETANMYKRLIKFIPEPIVLSDEGIVLYANNSALDMLQLKEEKDWLGQSIFQFIHPVYHADSVEVLSRVLETDLPSPFIERQLVRSDGTLIEVELSSIRIRNYMNKTVILSVIRDLTERKRSEEMLVRSEKLSLIGQMAAGVGHEIRNPLTALKGFTQLLRSRNQDALFYYDIMMNELDRISLIVDEFMSLAKPHLSEFKETTIEKIVKSVISLLDTQAIMVGVDIELELEEDLPTVFGDENQLKQVILNVVKNGIEAMPDGGLVHISAKRMDNDRLLIAIQDNGVGIPEELLSKVGEPFLTTKDKGTGLGLMVCNRIVDTHHGDLQLFSVKGEGTRVEITLPAMKISG